MVRPVSREQIATVSPERSMVKSGPSKDSTQLERERLTARGDGTSRENMT
jgi:hypothetical protein